MIDPPTDVHLQRTPNGQLLLRGTSALDNVGTGPIQFVAHRSGPDRMSASQQVERTGGGSLTVDTGAQVVFTFMPRQYGYWKFADAARFELWSLDSLGRRKRRVRTGPKRLYCLRDLYRTYPLPESPAHRQYAGCSKDRAATTVTLGTSVGWSDVYPADYYQQWIDVTGLHGRFAFYMVADPDDHIYESNELNNSAETIVTIP